MKFENVQIGDTVFTERKINYGWNSAKTFMIAEKVINVTKTQFTVESGDRYKKEGYKIGDIWTKAYKEGDYRGWYGKNILVCDETKQMEVFKSKLEAEREFNYVAENIKVERNSNFELSELKEMVNTLRKIQNIIKEKKVKAAIKKAI